MKTSVADWALLKKMRLDPPGTVRTVQERIAFEHHWDDLYQAGLEKEK